METLVIKNWPTSGFFSNCSVRLHHIVAHLNENKKLPDQVCSKQQFWSYQDNPETDVAKLLFIERKDVHVVFKSHVRYHENDQYSDYTHLPFYALSPLLDKYYTPTPAVLQREAVLIDRYGLDFKRIIGVYYRGNNKVTETPLASHELFFQRAELLLKRHVGMRFLVQTDELEFREEFCARFPNSVYFETLPVISRNPTMDVGPPPDNRIGFGIELLAAVRCLSQSACLITGSGNVSIWIVLFRRHARKINQYLISRFLHS